jgi:phytoene synthase
LYLPIEDLERFGVSEADHRAGCKGGAVNALLDFESRRARDYYLRAERGLPREDARRLAAARIMGAIYLNLLRRIEKSGYDVFGRPIRVPRWRQASIAAATWLSAMAGV